MSFPHTRRRFVVLSLALAAAGSVVAIGCGGDDVDTQSGDDASPDTGLVIDSSIIINEDSGKNKDAGVDANDAAVLCLVAPDAAIYGLDAIDAGAMTVGTSNCKGCHQPDLSGNATTPIGGEYPKNLTPDRATGLGCWTDDQIARAVLTGVDNQGNQLCVMPQFQASIGDGGISNVVAYLRSLPAVSNVVPGTMCPTDAGVDAD